MNRKMGDTRKATAGEIHELASTMELLTTLECPVCKEIPLPPIYICSNGHNVCSSCRTQLSVCGLCQAKLTDTRNYAIESIVRISKFKCKNEPDGCPEILKGEYHSDHLKICQYGPIPCYEYAKNRCTGTMIPFKDYFTHLKAHHEIAGEVEPSVSFSITCSAPNLSQDRMFPSFFMLYDDKEFLSNVRVKSGIVYWWVNIIANEDEAGKYRARLTLYKDAESGIKLEWTIPVHSVRKQFPEITEAGLCAAIPHACMQPFWKFNETTKKISWSTKYTIESM